MTREAIDAITAEIERARGLFGELTPDQWAAPSGCTGWRVQDVVTHMASVFHLIADPATIESGSSGQAEQDAEVPVQARREWTVDAVLAEYDEWSARGLAALAGLQEPPMADTVAPLGDLGQHPLHLLANAIAFDHYCHLRHDIGAAVDRAAALPHDPAVLTPALEWMLAGLPQMCASALATVEVGVNLRFDGPGGGVWTLAPADGGWTVSPGADPGLPTATSTAHDFVAWGTKRGDWRDQGVTLDDDRAAATLDAINVI